MNGSSIVSVIFRRPQFKPLMDVRHNIWNVKFQKKANENFGFLILNSWLILTSFSFITILIF